jgi:hypothetical protein
MFLRYLNGLPLISTLLFFIHGLSHNLTNVTRIKIQFNTITWTLCGIFFCPKMNHSLVHMPQPQFILQIFPIAYKQNGIYPPNTSKNLQTQ